jgi:uncharacterized membrane protein
MTSSLDLNLLPIARQGGQDLPALPDLYAVMPPRRPAHGREADSLVLYLSLTGNAPLSPEQHSHLLERLAQKYYKTSGSVTAALRAVAEALNLYLLDRNLRSTGGGRQGIGLLVLGVLRADTFYMAHCGPVQALLIHSSETRPLHELSSAGRGLGLSRTTPVRYVQARLADGDFLLLSSQPSPGWTATVLRHPQRQGIDGMRRLLMDYAVADINAVLIHAQAGTGRLRFLHRKPGAAGMAHEALDADVSSTPLSKAGLFSDQSTPVPAQPAAKGDALPQTTIPGPAPAAQPASSAGLRRAGMEQPLDSGPAASTPIATPAPRLERRPRPAHSPRRADGSPLDDLRMVVGKIGQGARRAFSGVLGALARVLKNLLPDEGTLKLPPGVMIFFALAVPLVLAVAGGMAFIKRGQSQQHQFYYEEAVLLASQAAPQTDPALQREGWNRVLEQLDKAEYYAVTADSQALRSQAIAVLDGLDGVQRLDFQPAIIGGLDDSVRITRMVANDVYLYMLNAHQGSVMLGVQIPKGYQINSNFQCGPTYGPITVGPLVDIVELPQGVVEDAVLLGMDTAGNLVYCTLTGQPLAKSLAQPSTGLGEPIALTIDQGSLYVLDPKVNAVWIYEGMDVGMPPHLFFGNEIPPMQDVIDLAVYDDNLYLLHSDGHLTQCSYSYNTASPTTCKEPFAYTDNRPGRVSGTVIPDSLFSQVSYVSFPDRSMYMLDPHSQAVFFFSVLFNFQTQYRAAVDLAEGQATAFAISTNRMIYLAISNSIYYAALP